MQLEAIETLSHLALHYLLSSKHGGKVVKKRILNLTVKSSLHWGIYGVSQKPFHWPTNYYEKRLGKKPKRCTLCNFYAEKSKQIQLHHELNYNWGPKKNRKLAYYKTKKLRPLCANCHSLEHRTGDHLKKIGGK